jgi:hypothetical protein
MIDAEKSATRILSEESKKRIEKALREWESNKPKRCIRQEFDSAGEELQDRLKWIRWRASGFAAPKPDSPVEFDWYIAMGKLIGVSPETLTDEGWPRDSPVGVLVPIIDGYLTRLGFPVDPDSPSNASE